MQVTYIKIFKDIFIGQKERTEHATSPKTWFFYASFFCPRLCHALLDAFQDLYFYDIDKNLAPSEAELIRLAEQGVTHLIWPAFFGYRIRNPKCIALAYSLGMTLIYDDAQACSPELGEQIRTEGRQGVTLLSFGPNKKIMSESGGALLLHGEETGVSPARKRYGNLKEHVDAILQGKDLSLQFPAAHQEVICERMDAFIHQQEEALARFSKLYETAREAFGESALSPLRSVQGVPSIFALRLPAHQRYSLFSCLAECGIQSTWYYYPLHLLLESGLSLPETEALSGEITILPFQWIHSKSQVEKLGKALEDLRQPRSASSSVRELSAEEWDEQVQEAISDFPFYQSTFLRSVQQAVGGQLSLFEVTDGQRWLLPCWRGKPWTKEGFKLSSIGYGGPIPLSGEGGTETAIRTLEIHLGVPFCGAKLAPGRVLPRSEFFTYSHVLFVDREPQQLFEEVLSGNCRTAIRKSRKEGIRVCLLDQVYWHEAHELLVATQRIVGADYCTQRELFFSWSAMKEARLLGAFFGEQLVAMSLLLLSPSIGFHLLHGWDLDHRKTCANQALIWHMILLTSAEGCREFHFGESHMESLRKAKTRWGAQEKPVHYLASL